LNLKKGEDMSEQQTVVVPVDLGKKGRLGNQLFQVAATIGIATRNRCRWVLPNWEYAESFKNPFPIVEDLDVADHEKIVFPDSLFMPFVPQSGENFITGYFQNEKYFEHCKLIVKEMFTSNAEISTSVFLRWSKIFEQNPVVVHVRRGDYISRFSDVFVNLADRTDYYERAMAQFKGRKFVFFSDDPDYVRLRFGGVEGAMFALEDNEIGHLFAMSLFGDHIVSNSTFSWWAAWLGENAGSQIVAPHKWFCEESVGRCAANIVPERWLKI